MTDIPMTEESVAVPPSPVRPPDWSDEDWEAFLAEEKESRPSSWRLEDGTIYSRNTPSWMYDDTDGNLLVDSMIVVRLGDPNYDFFAETVSDFYDHYEGG
jgi:hypothetical protein